MAILIGEAFCGSGVFMVVVCQRLPVAASFFLCGFLFVWDYLHRLCPMAARGFCWNGDDQLCVDGDVSFHGGSMVDFFRLVNDYLSL